MSIGVLSQQNQSTEQYLTFSLNGQEFAIDILQVNEIRNYTRITPLPNMPREVIGVINLRGSIVPIIDLRIVLGMEATTDYNSSVIIVARIESNVVGLIVDCVSDVIDLLLNDIAPPPALSSTLETRFVRGIASHDESLISLLDCHELVKNRVDFDSNCPKKAPVTVP